MVFDTTLVLQILASFFAGGFIIATLTVFAERAPRSISGIIAALPSTVIVGMISLVLIYDAEFVRSNRVFIPVMLLGAILFCLVYMLWARLICQALKSRWLKVFSSFLVACLGWAFFPVMTTYITVETWTQSVLIFLVVTAVLQFIFIKMSDSTPFTPIKHRITKFEYAMRFIFCGSIIASAIVASRLFGSFWGVAIASSFPAAFSSQMMVFHYQYGSQPLVHIIRMLPVGVTSLIVYNIVATESLAFTNIWWSTLYALIASMITSLLLSYVSHKWQQYF